MLKSHCIVCNSSILEPLYHPKDQPLAALSLPKTKEEALQAPRYPLEFVMCASCGHVFNVSFDYSLIPYQNDSNLMYNTGSVWMEYLKEAASLVGSYELKGKTIVDIGCGDGGFLRLLCSLEPEARYIGFEPGTEADNIVCDGIEIIKDYFVANRDIMSIKPDIIVCRHVIEHLPNPREFVEQIAYNASKYGVPLVFVAEVPNIENALRDLRVADYLYEHVSNFTPSSLELLFELCGFEIVKTTNGYKNEVTLVVAKLKNQKNALQRAAAAKKIQDDLDSQKKSLHKALEGLKSQNKSIALWGATGKGASFINGFELDAVRYPIVIDSDDRKCGKYTPGMGQLIRHSSHLEKNPVDIIVITTNWRASDVAAEIKRRGIECEKLLIVKNGEIEEVEK